MRVFKSQRTLLFPSLVFALLYVFCFSPVVSPTVVVCTSARVCVRCSFVLSCKCTILHFELLLINKYNNLDIFIIFLHLHLYSFQQLYLYLMAEITHTSRFVFSPSLCSSRVTPQRVTHTTHHHSLYITRLCGVCPFVISSCFKCMFLVS